jgi:hypothetical protein
MRPSVRHSSRGWRGAGAVTSGLGGGRRADEEERRGGGEVVVLARWAWSGGRRGEAERCMFGRRGGLEWWGPRVGMQNRETAGANCVLGMKIFLLHPQ